MSNGGGESGSHQRELHGKRKLHGNEFAHAVARMAVAQTCESVEVNTLQESQMRESLRFTSFQESALETLTEVSVRYIERIGKTAHLYTNMAGRTESNVLDIVQALEDLGSGLGFVGASDTDSCLADSGVVKDIIHYIGEAEEMPFVYSLPHFPFSKGKRRAPSFSANGVDPPDEHIPLWLPPFPEVDMQSKENGSNQLLMQPIHKSIDQKSDEKSSEEAEGNPFLALPHRFGEKEVSLLFRPAELSTETAVINHCPEILETFAPAIKAMESIPESEGGEKEPAERRSLVQFKIARTRNLEGKLDGKIAAWFREDSEKNEMESGKKLQKTDEYGLTQV